MFGRAKWGWFLLKHGFVPLTIGGMLGVWLFPGSNAAIWILGIIALVPWEIFLYRTFTLPAQDRAAKELFISYMEQNTADDQRKRDE